MYISYDSLGVALITLYVYLAAVLEREAEQHETGQNEGKVKILT